MTVIMRFLFL